MAAFPDEAAMKAAILEFLVTGKTTPNSILRDDHRAFLDQVAETIFSGGDIQRGTDLGAGVYPPATLPVGNAISGVVRDEYERFHLVDSAGNSIPAGHERDQEFLGIIRPVSDGEPSPSITGWEFIEDSAHFGGQFLQTPTMNLVGQSIEMDFPVQIDLIKSGIVQHDGQFISFQPGTSINSTTLSVSIFEQRSPWVHIQYRVDTGSITSNYHLPQDRATGTVQEGAGFESISHTLNGNEITLDFANNTYRGFPRVQIDYNNTLYHFMHDYNGNSVQPSQIKGRLFNADGSALTTIPGNFRLNISWELNREMDRIRVAPNDTRLLEINGSNFWIYGKLKRN